MNTLTTKSFDSLRWLFETRLADEFGVAVVITNQVVAQVDGGAMFQVVWTFLWLCITSGFLLKLIQKRSVW